MSLWEVLVRCKATEKSINAQKDQNNDRERRRNQREQVKVTCMEGTIVSGGAGVKDNKDGKLRCKSGRNFDAKLAARPKTTIELAITAV